LKLIPNFVAEEIINMSTVEPICKISNKFTDYKQGAPNVSKIHNLSKSLKLLYLMWKNITATLKRRVFKLLKSFYYMKFCTYHSSIQSHLTH